VLIDNATVTIWLGQRFNCCSCGDGILQTECGEECDNDPNFPFQPFCCQSCKIKLGRVCDDTNLCDVSACNSTAQCNPEPVLCSQPLDQSGVCYYNSCVAGECVLQCLTSACCNDNNNCTTDSCNFDNICEFELLPSCNCELFNVCYDCFGNNFTSCGFNLDTGSCFNINLTLYHQHPELFPSTKGIAYDDKTAAKLCVIIAPGSGNIGLIVGVAVAGAVVLALIIVGIVFYRQILRVLGSLSRVGGDTAAEGTLNVSPLYQETGTAMNPAYEPAHEPHTHE